MENKLNASFLDSAVDEFERLAVDQVILRRRGVDSRPSALVLPTGRCSISYELARKGASVTAADKGDFNPDDPQLYPESVCRAINFLPLELDDERKALANEPFDVIVVRRGISSLPYPEARKVLNRLIKRLKIGGKLYVSVLGLHSALGMDYPCGDADIGERYCELAPTMAERYSIQGKVCLYSERNLFALILEAGGSVLRTLTTTHGNVKGVAVRV